MKLVAFTGAAGCGKNEAANALVALGWKQVALADKMREALLALDPWIVEFDGHPVRLSTVVGELGWDWCKRTYPEVRRLLQRFGTEAGRDVHGENCWVDALFSEHWYKVHPEKRPKLAVSDVRFSNEAQAVIGAGGVVIQIIRPGLEPLPGSHASEAGIPDEFIDHVIWNDGTVENLHYSIVNLVEGLS